MSFNCWRYYGKCALPTLNSFAFTCEFCAASNLADLKLGELVHDDMFGLFEAMSAIEMMDPKMDAGMICNRGSKKTGNFDDAVEVLMLSFDRLKYFDNYFHAT